MSLPTNKKGTICAQLISKVYKTFTKVKNKETSNLNENGNGEQGDISEVKTLVLHAFLDSFSPCQLT